MRVDQLISLLQHAAERCGEDTIVTLSVEVPRGNNCFAPIRDIDYDERYKTITLEGEEA